MFEKQFTTIVSNFTDISSSVSVSLEQLNSTITIIMPITITALVVFIIAMLLLIVCLICVSVLSHLQYVNITDHRRAENTLLETECSQQGDGQ
jgi:hypothetical protein